MARATPGSALAQSGEAADGLGHHAVGEPVQECPLYGWIELRLVGEDGLPVPHAAYEIKPQSGPAVSGRLDGDGVAREKVAPGPCSVTLLGLDGAAWEPLSSKAGEPRTLPPRAANPPPPSPREGEQALEAGEPLAALAFRAGLLPSTIWEHAKNAGLREQRRTPNALAPRDRVFVPAPSEKRVTLESGQVHTLRRRGYPAPIRLRLLDGGKPRADQSAKLTVDGGEPRSVRTDGDGVLLAWVPPTAKEGRLVFDGDGLELTLAFGGLAAANALLGVQQRLSNLGFVCDDEAGTWGARTQAAVDAFQAWCGVLQTGQLDEPTRRALVALHDGAGARGRNQKGGSFAARRRWTRT